MHKLRDNYEVWVIPMLNVDGVVLGNNESNSQGRDLGLKFLSDMDPNGYLNRAHETEILRAFLKKEFGEDTNRLKMFFDFQIFS